VVIRKILKSLLYRVRIVLNIPNELYRYSKSQNLNGPQHAFAENLRRFKASTNEGNEEGIVLVQMVRDYENTIKIAATSKVIAEHKNLKVDFYDLYIDKINYTHIPPGVKYFQGLSDKLFSSSLLKIYKSFARKMMFSNSVLYADQNKILREKGRIIDEIKAKGIEWTLSVEMEGILVGDLIYDTYLRFNNRPTILSIDLFLTDVIECTLNIFYSFLELIQKKNIKCLINTYSSYIHHGISARICLKHNIEVYTIGSGLYFCQKLSNEFPHHAFNHTLISPNKKPLPEHLALAKEKLTSRFTGALESATSYMRKSAFFETPVNEELRRTFSSGKRNMVLYAHDFYDSPHVYRELQFPDLYQYLKQTIEALIDLEGTNIYIKIHPNSIDDTKIKTRELIQSFNKNNFFILDESVSNLNIIELKPDLIFTARGTVGIEMAYFEIPVVALYDNPYVNFNFVYTARTKEEYYSILRGEKSIKIDFDKKKIYSFYYQAYIEKTSYDTENIIGLLASFNGNTYCDEYLEMIRQNSDQIFSDKTLALFETSYFNENIQQAY
jgi:hypothetical protein